MFSKMKLIRVLISFTVIWNHIKAVTLPFECSFETETVCYFRQRIDDQFDWRRNNGSTASQNTGPTNASHGQYYMYIETSDPWQNNDSAILETPQIDASGATCLEFSYHMYGENINKLSLYTTSRGMSLPWRVISKTNVNRWMTEKVQLKLKKWDRVGFIGTRGKGVHGDIAIDNIRIYSGQCVVTLPFQCSFEMETVCYFRQRIDDQFDWRRNSGYTASQNTGPTNASHGRYYMYIETSNPRQNNDSAILETPQIDASGDTFLEFSYHMYGENINKLSLYTTSRGMSLPWRVISETNVNRWMTEKVQLKLKKRDRVGFIGTRGNGFHGDIAIDDIRIYSGQCEVTLPFECSFEMETICYFRQRIDDQFDWRRKNGSTASQNTGPTNASHGQYYMYIETSDPRQNNDSAILETPQIDASGATCLEFSYHMYGENINKLSLYTTSQGMNLPWRVISETNVNRWMTQKVQLKLKKCDRVGFIGTRGNGVHGDIAIDDIRIYSGQCEKTLPFTCSFELDLCGMFQRTKDNFDWMRKIGHTDSEGTGPSSARLGIWYVYADASSPREQNDRAYLETPSLLYSGSLCVSFYYHMYDNSTSDQMGILNVYRYRDKVGNTSIFTREGNQGNMWHQAEIITEIQERDKIVFAAFRGRGIRSDIAIDGLVISVGSCEYKSLCRLPVDPGPCTVYFRKWFFNKKTKTCEMFLYGSCEGNANRFNTERECISMCGCKLRAKVGPCTAELKRWFYNKKTKQCEIFYYGGCKGNSNRFETEMECQSMCDRCYQPPENGPCRGYFLRYHFDYRDRNCKMFIYGGCGGNANNFKIKRKCEKACDKLHGWSLG